MNRVDNQGVEETPIETQSSNKITSYVNYNIYSIRPHLINSDIPSTYQDENNYYSNLDEQFRTTQQNDSQSLEYGNTQPQLSFASSSYQEQMRREIDYDEHNDSTFQNNSHLYDRQHTINEHRQNTHKNQLETSGVVDNSLTLEYQDQYEEDQYDDEDDDDENQDQNPESIPESSFLTKAKILYVSLLTNALALSLFIMLLQLAFKFDRIQIPHLESMQREFKKNLIQDFLLNSVGQDCGALYKPISMTTWPGYKNLCSCPLYSYLGQCKDNESQNDCKNIKELESKELQSWDNKQICVRRSSENLIQYYQKSSYSSDANSEVQCQDNQKKCLLSKNGNYVCVHQFELCPIVQVQILNNSKITNQSEEFRYSYNFENKKLFYSNSHVDGLVINDIILQYEECNELQDQFEPQLTCIHQNQLHQIDRASEAQAILYTSPKENKDIINAIQKLGHNYGLYATPLTILLECVYNGQFNPYTINSKIESIEKLKFFLFVNPYFLSTLFILNMMRVLGARYFNSQSSLQNKSTKRKKAFYHVFGKYFIGSALVISFQVGSILYFILWGYLLLNDNKQVIGSWKDFSCLKPSVQSELSVIYHNIIEVESYNVVIIGSMIVSCILEALFSSYSLLSKEGYEQIKEETT